MRIYRQTGGFLREMTLPLQQPFQEGLATGAWVSSGRVPVSYEGEADDPKDAITYLVYDAVTGQPVRACDESEILRAVGIGTAERQ